MNDVLCTKGFKGICNFKCPKSGFSPQLLDRQTLEAPFRLPLPECAALLLTPLFPLVEWSQVNIPLLSSSGINPVSINDEAEKQPENNLKTQLI